MADLHKTDIAERIAKSLKTSPAAGAGALNAVLSVLEASLKRGDRVVVTGFGAFEARQVKERKVHSIRGGGIKSVPAHRRVAFSAGAELAAAVH